MKTKAIIVDLDYTLVDASRGIHLCITHALKMMGYPESGYKKSISTIGLSFPHTFESLTGKVSPEETLIFENFFIEKAKEVLIENTHLFDTVKPFLNMAKGKGYKLAIVTSKYRDALDDILNKFQINQYFDFHIAGDEVKHPKPHPMSLETAIRKLNVTLDETVYVGDSITDAEAAHRAGVKFIAVLTGPTKKEAFAEYASVAILDNLGDLLETVSAFSSVMLV